MPFKQEQEFIFTETSMVMCPSCGEYIEIEKSKVSDGLFCPKCGYCEVNVKSVKDIIC